MPSRMSTAIATVAAALLAGACSAPASENTTATTTSAATSGSPPASASPTGSNTPAPVPSVATPLVGHVISAPIPVPATDGKTHLAYELQLTNVLDQPVTLTSVQVRSGGQSLLSLPGDRLGYWTRIAGTTAPTTVVGPAQSAFVWLDVALPSGQPAPRDFVHAVGLTLPRHNMPLFPGSMTVDIAPVTVQARTPVVISPPLAGPNWLDGNSCCDMTAHRMAMNPINGELWAAERFAIDYIQLGPDGRAFTGNKNDVKSYPYFGADILAVGDGPVVATLDGLDEQTPGVSPTGLPLEQYGGNHVVQDLGGGNYAFYAHMQTGSVKVNKGDVLRAGQVIGALGNSGNSDAPHLHFHVMSTPDPLRSDGLPFVFESYDLDSRMQDSPEALQALLDGAPASRQPGFAPRAENRTSPLVYDVMNYADR